MSGVEKKKFIRFEMRLSLELEQEIDDWRSEQARMPNRTKAVRRLIELGLQAEKLRAAQEDSI